MATRFHTTGAAGALFLWVATAQAQAPAKVDFGRDVQPLFRMHCYGCHGPSQQMNNLRLDRRSSAMKPATGGSNIGPGNSAGSRLYQRLIGSQFGAQMPPAGRLSDEEIAVIKAWIDQGADWPDALAGEAPASKLDPRAVRLMEALRNGDRPAFEKLLRQDPQAAKQKGPGGATPLMYAALYGDLKSVRLLLEKGADPNAKNDAGATALHWAVDDPEKTRLLLERGADANARSDDAQTPVLIAASRFGSAGAVELLLDRGAEAPLANVLRAAVAAEDDGLMRSLLARGANLKPLPLDVAVRFDCARCVDLLMPHAARDDLNRALAAAARAGDSRAMRMLLDRGAEANANILRLAAFSEKAPAEAIRALIDRGADPHAAGAGGETALDAAKRHGDSPVVELLRKAGVKESPSAPAPAGQPKPAPSVRAAIERSLPLLQRTDVAFLKKSGCVSCHNNNLAAMAVAAARKHGLPVNEEIARSQLRGIGAFVEANRERLLQAVGIPGGTDTAAYILLGLAAEKYPPNSATDALARYLKNRQAPDGRWRIQTQGTRPPLESSDFENTAAALRSLRVYAPKPLRGQYEESVRRAADWLRRTEPHTNEDRVFQILGLTWAARDREFVRRAARDLLAEQRPDGGWGQLPFLASDAYATGQALVALSESGLAAGDPAYKRGVAFLLRTQHEDGSWFVKSRAIPVQPYFDAEFPYGQDQFISAAATNWAVMALAPAARP
jgi:ankyrin repeat protein